MTTREYNFDGLIGPTHNYAGLAVGNLASAQHQNQVSSPKAAALQGLVKMKYMADLGIGQCVLPPLRRPRLELLSQLGFSGSPADMIDQAWRSDRRLVAHCYSASSMWTANAATVSPGFDTRDSRLHFTPANLASSLHRSIESGSTKRNLDAIFPDDQQFVVHAALPCSATVMDEGAANQIRLCGQHGQPGIEIFAYGVDPADRNRSSTSLYPARQTLIASQAVARRHQLHDAHTLFWQQSQRAIDAGVFHNDVISVGNENVLLCHQDAFVDQAKQLAQLRSLWPEVSANELHIIEVSASELPLSEAVSSYLFNSQLLTMPDGSMLLVCPTECEQNPYAGGAIQNIIGANNPITDVAYQDLRQSMNNGGGPACLRLRVVLNAQQQAAMHQGVILTDSLSDALVGWVNHHYRDELHPDDLRDPDLIDESFAAIEQLAGILKLPASVLADH